MASLNVKMPIDIQKLIDFRYLFEPRPEPNSELIFPLAVSFGLLLLASGLVWLIFLKRERQDPLLGQIRQRLVRWLFNVGFIGLLLSFFRWQGIRYLGSRFWLLLWLIIGFVWLAMILWYLLKKFPKERSLNEVQKLRERYLPKPKVSRT